MMMLNLFSLGLRFVIYPQNGLDKSSLIDVLFESISPSLTEGVQLYCCNPPQGEQDMERVTIAVLSNMSLKKAKRLYQVIQRNQYLCSYLAQYHPFVQNNYLERCGDYEYLGVADSSGKLHDGELSMGCMQFYGPEPKDVMQLAPVRILSVSGPHGAASSMDINRLIMRSVSRAQPLAAVITQNISCGGKGTTDALVISCGGKYVPCPIENPNGERSVSYYGLLPDDTAVIDTSYSWGDETSFSIGALAVHAVRSGCLKIVVAGGDHSFKDRGEGCRRALAAAAEDVKSRFRSVQAIILYDEPDDLPNTVRVFTDFSCIKAEFGLDAILAAVNFEPRLRESTNILLIPGKNSARVKTTVDHWMEYSQRHMKHFASPALSMVSDLSQGLDMLYGELTRQVDWLRAARCD